MGDNFAYQFFLADTLVPACYDRKGFRRFVADRAVRLGVPSLVFMPVLDPLIGLIRGATAVGGVDWAAFIAGYRAFALSGRFLGAPGPPWFAVALLVFSVVYAGVRLDTDALRGSASKRPASPRLIKGRAISIGAVCLIAFFAWIAFFLRLVQPLGASGLNMQLDYSSSYVVLSAAGLSAGRNGLLAAIPAKLGRAWLWVSIVVGLPLRMAVQGFGGALGQTGTCSTAA
jgi:glucans biosynthesis protein C